tara:strand:+ start:2000 stop:2296 length:297 start_codon:yes stop_codon:yes gene_type:complete
MKNQRKNNSINFIFYTMSILAISSFLLIKIYLKNEYTKTQNDISQLNNTLIHNTDIVKDLQSSRDYLLTHNYISNFLADKMVVAVPETLIINMNNHIR